MNNSDSFYSPKKFFARERFPYGLARSGDFTREQATLLESHGFAYEGIHNGVLAPANEEESHFLSVCRGETEALTAHEKAWMRYCQKTQKRAAVSAFGSSRAFGSNTDNTNVDTTNDADDFDSDWQSEEEFET